MNLSDHILGELRSGQNTADAIALRLRLPKAQVQTILDRHETDGRALSHPISGLESVKAYRLKITSENP